MSLVSMECSGSADGVHNYDVGGGGVGLDAGHQMDLTVAANVLFVRRRPEFSVHSRLMNHETRIRRSFGIHLRCGPCEPQRGLRCLQTWDRCSGSYGRARQLLPHLRVMAFVHCELTSQY